MKFAAIVVLYNPTNKEVNHVLEYRKDFDKIYVFDNSSKCCSNVESLCEDSKFQYICDNQNHGLAVAYNFGMKQAKEEGFSFLCILDQDSVFSANSIQRMKSYIKKHNYSNVAIYAPYIQYGLEENVDTSQTKKCKWVINSGAFLNLSLLEKKKIYYDENYFIDRLDRDYSKQIEQNELNIIQVKNCILQQTLGERLGNSSIHSCLRNYYMFRNRFYYNRKFYHGWHGILMSFMQTIKQLIGIIVSRNDIRRNLQYFIYALKDDKNRKYGKKDEIN